MVVAVYAYRCVAETNVGGVIIDVDEADVVYEIDGDVRNIIHVLWTVELCPPDAR